MRYPGGKGASGCVQQVINQIPPHRVYIEPFIGGGAVFLAKSPAASSILMDRDPAVAELWMRSTSGRSDVEVLEGCALRALSSFTWRGDEFVYLDPPYHPAARSHRRIYRCELEADGHDALLALLARLPVKWALSGYRCQAYDDAAAANGWRRVDFQAMTRGGVRTESLWMNYEAPAHLAEYGYVGRDFRERQRIKRKVDRWLAKLDGLPQLERAALLAAMRDRYRAGTGEAGNGGSE